VVDIFGKLFLLFFLQAIEKNAIPELSSNVVIVVTFSSEETTAATTESSTM